MDAIQGNRSIVPSRAASAPAAVPSSGPRDSVLIGESPRNLKVTLHVPAGEGKFLEVRKFSIRLEDRVIPRSGTPGAVFVERGDDAQYVTRADLAGQVQYRVPVDDKMERLTESADGSRLYVVERGRLRALDPESGRTVGEKTFAEEKYFRKLLPQADGRVALLDGADLVWLDADLQETSRQTFPWDVRNIRALPHGTLVQGPNNYYHLGNMKVLDEAGTEVFASEQVRPHSVATLPDGRLQLLEYSQIHDMALVTVDPAVGEVGRKPSRTDAKGVWPLENGTTLVSSNCYDGVSSAFTLHDAGGTPLRTYDFARTGKARNLLVDEARQVGYAVVQSSEETSVWRLDLSKPPEGTETPVQDTSYRDGVFGSPTLPVLVHKAPTNLVVPPVFEDGRLAVCGRDKVTMYGADGAVAGEFASLQSFVDGMGSTKFGINRVLGDNPMEDRATLRQWTELAAKWLPLPDRKSFLDSAPLPGVPRRGPDRTMEFAQTVDAAAALEKMRIPDQTVYQRMVIRQDGGEVAVGEVGRDMSFPDGVSGLNVAREKVTWQLPGQEPKENKHLDVAAALPVKAGDDYYVAMAEHAGGTDRALSWCHPASETFHRFDVTQPISGLFGGDRDAVYAVGRNGAVLMIEPPLEPGEHVETRVKLPRSLMEPPTDGGRIVRGEDTVVIGGIVLKRRN